MAKRQAKSASTGEVKHSIPKVVKRIEFKTENQKRFYTAINHPSTNVIMAHALAGAGKTFTSIQCAIQMLLDKASPIEKVIIMNPTVDVGGEDKLGYLPGTLEEKIQIHNESSLFILNKIIGKAETNKLIENGKIEFVALNFLRGINYEKTFVILDEAQNASPLQVKTLLTRISDDSKLIIQGDLSQTDKYKNNGTPGYTKSGFYDAWKRLGGVSGIYQVEFTKDDCIRSGIVKRILEQYETDGQILLGEKNTLDLTYYHQLEYDSNELISII
jgi:phosphate starvation-inducible PhoH-like protein